MKIVSKEDIANRLPPRPISEACIEALRDLVADEEYEEAFIRSATAYIRMMRSAAPYECEPAAEARERIKRVKKAFDKLTEQDKSFLDFNTTDSDDYLSERPHVCESIQRALNTPVPKRPKPLGLSLEYLSAFARLAVREKWIDVTENSNALKEVLNAMMKEAGVKHNSTVIALEAIKTPSLPR